MGNALVANTPPANPVALVVDDDGLIRMNACDILEEAGYTALEAEHGDQAIAVLEQQQGEVQLLFTDVQMPGSRDGFALASEVARRWPRVAIIIASGQAEPKPGDIPEDAKFIRKPFSAELVHEHLRDVVPEAVQPKPLRGR